MTVEPTIVRQLAALLDSRDAPLREEIREFREEIRESARSIRKEMRFLAAGIGGLAVAGFLYLNASLTDLSVTLARDRG